VTSHRRRFAVLVVASLVLWGCRESSETASRAPAPTNAPRPPATVDNPAYDAVAGVLREPGALTVCSRRSDSGDASGSYEQRIFSVAAGACGAESGAPAGTVVVNAYDSLAIRDQSAGVDFGGRLVAWTYLQFVVSVGDESAPEVVSGVERAMAALGAQKTYDERAAPPGFSARPSG
jgi:hypothetical protein